MFQPRSSEFDPRVSAIVDHLRAIEKELGAIGKSPDGAPLQEPPPPQTRSRCGRPNPQGSHR